MPAHHTAPAAEAPGRIKQVVDVCQSLVTIAGIVAAGFWFIVQQQCGPKVKIEHRVSHRESAVDPSKYLVAVDVFLSNVGNVGVTLECGHLRVLNVNPGDADGKPELIWPKAPSDPACLENMDIEPNGGDQAHTEILVDRGVKTIRVRSFFKNPKTTKNIGWELISLYDLDTGKAGEKTTGPGSSPPEKATEP